MLVTDGAGATLRSGWARSTRGAGGTVDNETTPSEGAAPKLGGKSVIGPCAVVPASELAARLNAGSSSIRAEGSPSLRMREV